MAASLSLTSADVQTPQEMIPDVRVLIRQNHLTLRRGSTVVAEAEVSAVRRVERRRWELDLVDGTVWSVVQAGRRCCGGR